MNWLVRDALELAMLVALGGAIVAAWKAWGRGQITPSTCVACQKPVSRAYAQCRHCGAIQPDRRVP